jgi:hypothetical protein
MRPLYIQRRPERYHRQAATSILGQRERHRSVEARGRSVSRFKPQGEKAASRIRRALINADRDTGYGLTYKSPRLLGTLVTPCEDPAVVSQILKDSHGCGRLNYRLA